jgi:hypothetical protein
MYSIYIYAIVFNSCSAVIGCVVCLLNIDVNCNGDGIYILTIDDIIDHHTGFEESPATLYNDTPSTANDEIAPVTYAIIFIADCVVDSAIYIYIT